MLDATTQKPIGHMVNMSQRGCMLRSEQPFAVKGVHLLTFVLPEEVNGRRRMNIEVQCSWCQPSRYNQEFGAGFEIVRIKPEDRQRWEIFCGG